MSGNRFSLTPGGGGGDGDDSQSTEDAIGDLDPIGGGGDEPPQDGEDSADAPATGDSSQDTGLTEGGATTDPAPAPAPEPDSGQSDASDGGGSGPSSAPSGGSPDTTTPTSGGSDTSAPDPAPTPDPSPPSGSTGGSGGGGSGGSSPSPDPTPTPDPSPPASGGGSGGDDSQSTEDAIGDLDPIGGGGGDGGGQTPEPDVVDPVMPAEGRVREGERAGPADTQFGQGGGGSAEIATTIDTPLTELSEQRQQELLEQARGEAEPGEEITLAPNPMTDGARVLVGDNATAVAEQMTATAIEQDLEQQVGRNLQRGEDFVIQPSDEGIQALTTPAFRQAQRERQRQQAAETFDQQLGGIDVTQADVQRQDDQFTLDQNVQQQFQRQQAAASLDEQLPGVDVSPSDVIRQDDQFTVDQGVQQDLSTRNASALIGGIPGVDREQLGTVPDTPARVDSPQVGGQADAPSLTEGVVGGGEGPQTGGDSPERVELLPGDTATQVEEPAVAQPGTDTGLVTGVQRATSGEQATDVDVVGGVADAITGPPGTVESAAGDVVSDIGDASTAAADTVTQEVVDPTAGAAGEAAESIPVVGLDLTSDQLLRFQSAEGQGAAAGFQDEGSGVIDTQPETVGGQITESFVGGIGSGAAQSTVGLPGEAARIGGTVADAGEFTFEAVREEGVADGAETAAEAGADFATTAAAEIVQQAQRNPSQFAGNIVGGSVAASAVTPFRLRRTDVPTSRQVETDIETETQAAVRGTESDIDTTATVTETTGSTTVRGLRAELPPVVPGSVRQRLGTEGRTLAGTVDGRPTRGAPAVDTDAVDFGRLGGEFDVGNTFDPRTPFEADVFGASLRASASTEAAQRFETRRDLQRQLATVPAQGEVRAEDILSRARDVPAGQTDEIIDAIDDIGGTIKGSAASAEQAAAFRQPRDLDLAVPDEAAARSRLGDALEGTDRSVNDVFDIVEDPAFNEPGFISGGQESQPARASTEGILVNPLSEEGIRKGQGAATIRGPETAAREDINDIDGVDVGPKPTGTSPSDITRQKDVVDLSAIARSAARQERTRAGGLNPFARRRAAQLDETVDEFESQFEPEMEAATEPVQDIPTGESRALFDFDTLRADVRGQADLTGTRRGPDLPDVTRRRGDVEATPRAGDSTTGGRPTSGGGPVPILQSPGGRGGDSGGLFGAIDSGGEETQPASATPVGANRDEATAPSQAPPSRDSLQAPGLDVPGVRSPGVPSIPSDDRTPSFPADDVQPGSAFIPSGGIESSQSSSSPPSGPTEPRDPRANVPGLPAQRQDRRIRSQETRDPDNDDDDRDQRLSPFGSEFQNPVQSGADALAGIVQTAEQLEGQDPAFNPQGERDSNPFGRF